MSATGLLCSFIFSNGAEQLPFIKMKEQRRPVVLFKKLQDLSGVTGLLWFIIYKKETCQAPFEKKETT